MQDFAHEYGSKPTFETLEDIKDKKVTVMGLGLNGGGEASVRFFLRHGAFVTITDMKTEEQLSSTVQKLNEDPTIPHERIRYVLGKHEIEDFEKADCVIKNPGVKFSGNKFLEAAKNIETDLSIFLHFTKAPIVAVTGSKGKSSTVSAIHYGLSKAGFETFLGGNITVSPLTFLEKTNEKTPVVLELSSWQLSDLRGRKLLKPFACVITKIVPDHQNWYGSMEPYVADKKLIYRDQDKSDFALFTKDDEWGEIFASECNARIGRYSKSKASKEGCWLDSKNLGWIKTPFDSEPQLAVEKLSVPGQHMRENVLNAAYVMRLFGIPSDRIKTILAGYSGIEHRLEFFHEWKNPNGINFRFYNDSAATVPEAAGAAITSFEEPPVMVCGGTDKNLDFTPLAQTACKAKKLFLLAGTGTDKLTPLLDQKKIQYEMPAENLEELVESLYGFLAELKEMFLCGDGDNIPVVFSPGATSFGMFNNEFDRGNKYKAAVLGKFKR